MRRSSLGARTLDHRLPKGSRRHGASDDSRPCRRSLDRHCPPDARHGHGRRHPARLVRVLRRPVGADDGGDDAARRGPGRLESRARQRSGARRAAVCRVIPRRLDTRRRPRVGSRTHATDVNRKETEVKLPKVVSQDDWTAARKRLLAKEKEFSRQRDALSAERRKLPMVAVEKEYMFEGPEGRRTLADLFDGKRQLVTYHFMFGPDWGDEGCPACSYVVDNIAGSLVHLAAGHA